MTTRTLTAAFIGTLVLSAIAKSACNGDYEVSALPFETPTSDFIDHRNGTVTHKTTGLMWKRCSEGQVWRGNTCTGTAQAFSWEGAQLRAQEANAARDADHDDWRVPYPYELRTIVETRCWNPSVNGDIFPQTPPNWFWTAAAYTGHDLYAWEVGFLFGDLSPSFRTSELRVRLVRNAD
ncbi:DUF1566 domain-containing protein [Salinispirillum sp. LH 10-3-1]|uniref:DUF1566 domain-containing protein n=1 Tax=Salinispirillum sp. LH 10-3-1 TaxID=2952525 RepID=A0AB38YFM1_9GAMM